MRPPRTTRPGWFHRFAADGHGIGFGAMSIRATASGPSGPEAAERSRANKDA
jgi:hypothetical protein